MAANTAFARVSGPVLNTDRRQGTSTKSGKPYDFTTVRVLVGAQGITEFTWPSDSSVAGPLPARGEMVDLFCELSSSEYGLRVNVLGFGSNLDDESISLLASLAS